MTLPGSFNRSLEEDFLQILNEPLKEVTFGSGSVSNQSLGELPNSLEKLHFSRCFNQSLENFEWPSGLKELRFGFEFNQSMENVRLPDGLEKLTFVGFFEKIANRLKDSLTFEGNLECNTNK